MKTLKSIFVVTLFLLIVSGVCRGEPTPSVKYLMQTPVSVFDFGMYKMERALEKQAPSLSTLLLSYNWEKNRILIRVLTNAVPPNKNVSTAKAQCMQVINDIRRFYYIDLKTGKERMSKLLGSRMGSFFSHEGYAIESAPKNVDKELYNITEILIHSTYIENGKQIAVDAKAPLLGTEVMFSIEPEN